MNEIQPDFISPKRAEELAQFGKLLRELSKTKNISLFGGLINGQVRKELNKGWHYEIFLNAFHGETELKRYFDIKAIKLISANRTIRLLIKRKVFTPDMKIDNEGLRTIIERARRKNKSKKKARKDND